MNVVDSVKSLIRQHFWSLFLFASVGTMSAIVYFSLFTLLWKVLSINYMISVSIAYLTTVTFYFFTNRYLTFKSHHGSIKKQLGKFVLMVLLNYLITVKIIHYAVETLALTPYIGMLFAVATTFIISYLLSKFWVFKKPVMIN